MEVGHCLCLLFKTLGSLLIDLGNEDKRLIL